MAEIAPFDPSIGAGGDVAINPKQRQNVNTFLNNWTTLQQSPSISRFAPENVNAIRDYDARRVLSGTSPLSKQASALAIIAAQNRATPTAPPEPDRSALGIIGNFGTDIVDVFKSIPQLVGHFAHQIAHPVETIQKLANVAEPLDKKYGTGFGGITHKEYVGDMLKAISEAPILELLPGVRTLSAVLPGGIEAGQIADHPGMTALDVLPVASRFAKGTAVAEAARAADLRVGRHPLTALATRTLDSEGNVVMRPSVSALEQRVNASGPGNFVRSAFGRDVSDVNLTKEDLARGAEIAFTETRQDRIPTWVTELPQYPQLRELHDLSYGQAERFGVPKERVPELTRLATTAPHEVITGLPPQEAALVQTWHDISDALGSADAAVNELVRDPLTTETYTRAKGGTIVKRTEQIARLKNTFRDTHLEGLTEAAALPGADHRLGLAVDHINNGDFAAARQLFLDLKRTQGKPGAAKVKLQSSAGDAIRMHRAFHDTVAPKEAKLTRARDALATYEASPHATPTGIASRAERVTIRETAHATAVTKFQQRYVNRVQRWMGQHPNIDPRLVEMWAEVPGGPSAPERFTVANFDALFDREGKSPFTPGGAVQDNIMSVSRLNTLARDLTRINDTERALVAFRENNAPPRFEPIIRERVRDEILSRAQTPEQVQAAMEALARKRWADAVTVPPDVLEQGAEAIARYQKSTLNGIAREQTRMWQQLRDEGYDPVFMHQVSPGKELGPMRQRAMIVRHAGHTKERPLLDVTPFRDDDLTLALTHQAFESVNRHTAQFFYEDISDRFGKTFDEVRALIDPVATRRSGGDPARFLTEQERLLKQSWRQVEPESMFGVTGPTVAPSADVAIFIPKYLGDALVQMNTLSQNKFSAAIEPVTSLFRVATTALSLRTQVNNLTGNALLTALYRPSAFRETVRATRLMRGATEFAQALSEKSSATVDDIASVINSPSHASFLSELGSTARDFSEAQWMAGRTVHRLLAESNSPLARGLMRTMDATGKVAQGSMKLNSWFDDLNRSILYLSETKAGLRRGLSPADAATEGVMLSRRVAMQWKMLTPFERSSLRPLIPFYAFQKHMVKYAMSFPFDHPVRASIMANVVGTELEDQKTGYPELFHNAFFFNDNGKANKTDREQVAVNLGGMNPFAQLGSTFGLLGFLSGDSAQAGESLVGVNPMLKALMETVGFDPRAGTADLYPDLHYNPTTGQLGYKAADNPILNLATNIIPQTTIIANLLGWSADYRDMARQNPAAAKRQILSGAGVPILWRNFDVPLEYGRGEIRRDQARKTALTQALKSGDWSQAEKWPGNRKAIDSLRALQEQNPQALQAYTMAPTPESAAALREQLQALSGRR